MLGDADSDFSGSVFLAVSVWYGKSQPGSLFACLWMLSIAKTKKNRHRWTNYSIGQRWKVSGIWEVKLVLLGKKIMTR